MTPAEFERASVRGALASWEPGAVAGESDEGPRVRTSRRTILAGAPACVTTFRLRRQAAAPA